MADIKKIKHFYFQFTAKPEKYKYNGQVVNSYVVPARDRAIQAAKIQSQLTLAKTSIDTISEVEASCGVSSVTALQLKVVSYDGVEMPVESLADARQKVELLKVMQIDDAIIATISIQEKAFNVLNKKLENYTSYKKRSDGVANDSRSLIDSIESIAMVTLRDLWSDAPELFPDDEEKIYWWEVWVSVGESRDIVIEDLRKICKFYSFELSQRFLVFPERSVFTLKACVSELEQASALLVRIAELRLFQETADFFLEIPLQDQRLWAQELNDRLQLAQGDNPYVCVLDTGVSNGHPLIQPFLNDDDQYVVDVDWDTADSNGHGTGIAGLVIWGDLVDCFVSDSPVRVGHRLESVKLLRFHGDNSGKHLGLITSDGVSLPAIEKPDRKRIFVMALSSKSTKNRGLPSAWSATLDALISDDIGMGAMARLLIVSAGNVDSDLRQMMRYPMFNHEQEIHDPGQSWNAITVGACTNKTTIDPSIFPNTNALAPAGCLSPYSSTSHSWDTNTPLKPEVVFEGGNIGIDSLSCAGLDSLHLMTTSNEINSRQFSTFYATSAATALAANFCAKIMSVYTDLWPETIRAVMIHSASWTEAMDYYASNYGSTNKQRAQHLMRSVGYGVPNLERALWTLKNCLTYVIQDEIQPFIKVQGKVKTNEMHVHDLPWPKLELLALGEVEVKMTVTLSYFIEPNPGARYTTNKYKYPSHQLRFDIKRPLETTAAFKRRISAAVEDDVGSKTSDPNWMLGNFRNKGSVHKDIWQGTAADLASRDHIIIFPVNGWWRLRPSEGQFERKARYSLVVTIEAASESVDLLTEVENRISTKISSETLVEIQ